MPEGEKNIYTTTNYYFFATTDYFCKYQNCIITSVSTFINSSRKYPFISFTGKRNDLIGSYVICYKKKDWINKLSSNMLEGVHKVR